MLSETFNDGYRVGIANLIAQLDAAVDMVYRTTPPQTSDGVYYTNVANAMFKVIDKFRKEDNNEN